MTWLIAIAAFIGGFITGVVLLCWVAYKLGDNCDVMEMKRWY